jgi:trimeric autotransporter adhesin
MKKHPNENPMKSTNILIITVALACIGLSLAPKAFAVVPAPDGGYPGFNTAEGQNALINLTTGVGNTAVGWFSLWSNTDGSFNTAVGAGTLLFNVGNPSGGEGVENTATGAGALLSNISGEQNTANGAFALFSNVTGGGCTAIGDRALFSNTEGAENTATGGAALVSNTTGSANTANGTGALFHNTTGSGNTASGFAALLSNNGDNNTANGNSALYSNDTGDFNTAVGLNALFSNTFGDSNTAIGYNALYNNNGPANAALGAGAGYNATTGSGNVYVGAGMVGVAGESNACYIASIFGQTSASGVQVYINSDNKLGTLTSSKRFKEDIKPMDKASEALLALKPVTFRYKKEIDPQGRSQFGLVAEEVEKVNPDLVVRDKDGKIYSVRYDQVNAMLLNEFLKEHCTVQEQQRKIEQQEATIAQLRKDVETVVAHAKEQDSQIQKVSAQLELNRPVPQVAGLSH